MIPNNTSSNGNVHFKAYSLACLIFTIHTLFIGGLDVHRWLALETDVSRFFLLRAVFLLGLSVHFWNRHAEPVRLTPNFIFRLGVLLALVYATLVLDFFYGSPMEIYWNVFEDDLPAVIEAFILSFSLSSVAVVAWFFLKAWQKVGYIKNHGINAPILRSQIQHKSKWGGVGKPRKEYYLVAGEYEYQGKHLPFSYSIAPWNLTQIANYQILKAKGGDAKISIKIDPYEPQNKALFIE